jgi:hypothetical protein
MSEKLRENQEDQELSKSEFLRKKLDAIQTIINELDTVSRDKDAFSISSNVQAYEDGLGGDEARAEAFNKSYNKKWSPISEFLGGEKFRTRQELGEEREREEAAKEAGGGI